MAKAKCFGNFECHCIDFNVDVIAFNLQLHPSHTHNIYIYIYIYIYKPYSSNNSIKFLAKA